MPRAVLAMSLLARSPGRGRSRVDLDIGEDVGLEGEDKRGGERQTASQPDRLGGGGNIYLTPAPIMCATRQLFIFFRRPETAGRSVSFSLFSSSHRNLVLCEGGQLERDAKISGNRMVDKIESRPW